MEFIELKDPADPRLWPFSRMIDAELRDPKQLIGLTRAVGDDALMAGLFIAESANVVDRAMDAGLTPFAVIAERRWEEQARALVRRAEGCPVDGGKAGEGRGALFVGSHEQVRELTGYERTRGPLAAFLRPALPTVEELVAPARRIAVLEDIANFTNVGAIFRSAAALGMDAVLVTPGCHDPLYRRASRVSMGAVFQVPWTRIGSACEPGGWAREGVARLHRCGFTVAALALDDDSVSLRDERVAGADRLALVLGTEGQGLSRATVEACDLTVRIPMAHGVDSLNVAAASAVAFWETRARER